ncbi:hypothetical protein BDN71DRAFT_1489553 [Pleurotus eryngii]|uniref:Uncharacterized protein n=1 Tax=Pleurotus eryngii TaxID=5323 RepID=A0A9P5ZSP3_PLEER|nr:hypothetical protein BDN71DRAFT_1489553 [Pleurotus eryngii]
MFILTLLLSLLVISVSGCDDHAKNSSIPLSTRIHWMQLSSPCPFAAFATAIVNHTVGGLGELVCIGINSNGLHEDPTLHGERIPITYQVECTSAVRWAGFREYIYGASIKALIDNGWGQISVRLSSNTSFIPGILTNETNPLFFWQFDVNATCPTGCSRVNSTCTLSA